jgi:hypothetical protein
MQNERDIWAAFREVSTVRFKSKSHTGIGWSGVGMGVVQVSEPEPDILLFTESGSWQQEGGKEIRFRNVFRWTKVEDRLRLDHLRFGRENPVFLFEMTVDADGVWREISPHPCRDDCYRASMRIEGTQIFVNWLVRGPKRDEVIDYIYL